MKIQITKSKIIILISLILLSVFSATVFTKLATSPMTFSKTIEVLDEKKMNVMELTAGATATSVAVAAIPSDATTPIANQISNLSSYLLIVVCAIFLEKILLTTTGLLTFRFLIPIACFLFAVYTFKKFQILKTLAIKLISFGLAIFMIIPVSVQITKVIDETFQTNKMFEKTIQASAEIENPTENTGLDEDVATSVIWNKVKDTVFDIPGIAKETFHAAETALSQFIDSIAVLIITSCVIPIAVLFFFIWIIKIIFGINVPIPKKNPLKKLHNKNDDAPILTEATVE